MFKAKNLRNNKTYLFNNTELKDLIIAETRGRYIGGEVKAERTSYRGSAVKEYLTENFMDSFDGVYLITANSYINSDKDTRHILISTKQNYDLKNYINPNVPIFYVHDNDFNFSEMNFSKWFRENMGKGFCITDIDHFLYADEVCVILEEKNFKPKNSPAESIPWSQKLSNKELIEEVLNQENINIFMYCFNINKEEELFVNYGFKNNYVVEKEEIHNFVQNLLSENFERIVENEISL